MKHFAGRVLEGYRRGRDLTRFAKILAGIGGPAAFVSMCIWGDPLFRFAIELVNSPAGGQVHPGGSNVIALLLPFIALAVGTLLPLILVGRRLPDRVHRREPAEIAVGSDGLLITARGEPRFVSFRDIVDAYAVDAKRLILLHADGTRTAFALKEAQALLDRLQAHLSRFAHEAEGRLPKVPEVVDVGAGAYRGAMSLEDLSRIALSPAADTEDRARAIRALASAPEPVRVKLRVAAEETADPEVQEAFAYVERAAREVAG